MFSIDLMLHSFRAFRASSVNEDCEYKIGLCKKPNTIVECQGSLI